MGCEAFHDPGSVMQALGGRNGYRIHPGKVALIPGAGAYAASKAAVAVLTRTAALEAIGSGIRINSVNPGPVDTPMSLRPGEDRAARDARMAQTNPSRRVAKLEEIAAAALWLCSDEAQYLVGHDLVVDGSASI